jgi:Cu2+-exporting ATPase
VARVAAELGIPLALGGQTPEQKLAYVRQLQADGAVVAMVGDGINDAAVLQAADVSFAMSSGAAVAQRRADAVLIADRIGLLAEASATASMTMRVIRQNIIWANVYNAVAIPLAAIGLITPFWSGIGMTASSMVVVLNALRLCLLARGDARCTAPVGGGAAIPSAGILSASASVS